MTIPSSWGALRARAFGARRTVPTREGVRFVLFALAVGIAAINTGNNLLYLILAMMLSLIVISGVLSECTLRGLELRRHIPSHVFANQPTAVSVTLVNRKRHAPSVSLRIRDVVGRSSVERGIRIPFVGPRASVLARYTLMAPRRGCYRLDGFHAVTRFPFSLFEKTAQYAGEAEILVCPALEPLPSSLWEDLAAMGQGSGLHRRGPGSALYNLREYRPGDDSRAIHWMTTARTSKLMLKETEADDPRAVTLVLSTVAPPTHEAAFERALSCAASLAVYFHEQGYWIRACIGEEDVIVGEGDAHCLGILEPLALCQRTDPGAGPARRWRSRTAESHGFVVAVLPWTDQDTEAVAARADCLISIDGNGELSHVTRPRLHV